MKAVVINNDKSLSWTDVENPSIKDNQVLIEVYAASINRADLLQREGSYPPPPGCPNYPGLEVAGVIKSVGKDTKKYKVGDKVCALLGGGGYAEYVAVEEETVLPMPNNMSFEEASAIPEIYATAYLNLFYVGNAKPGETLFINSAASGLASAIIPMAKAFGLYVITTVRGQKKVESVKYLNADVVIDSLSQNVPEVLKQEANNGHPVDISIDCLGGPNVNECLKYVNRGCRWIQIATLAGDMSNIDFRNIFVKNIRIIGSTLRSKPIEEKEKILSELKEKMWSKFESREIEIKVHKILPIEQADEAQQILYRNENIGKVILKVK